MSISAVIKQIFKLAAVFGKAEIIRSADNDNKKYSISFVFTVNDEIKLNQIIKGKK